MLSYIFLAYAVIHLVVYFWGWRKWAELGRPTSLFLVLFGATLLWYDNFRIGMGRFVGEGSTLYAMTVPAFAWHWSMIGILVIAAGSLARLADLSWSRSRIVMGLFCVAGVGLAALDIPKIFTMHLHPACLADTVRYTTVVSAAQLCRPTDAVFAGSGADAALVAIITNVIVLALGVVLWAKRGWPWLVFGPGVMFVAAGGFATSKWALPISNLGEIFFNTSYVITCVHFARQRVHTHQGQPAAAIRQAA